jgi:Icc-related predicted phosphoesterase
MKILAFVDTHGSMAALKKIISTAKKEKIDYLVCAGDVTIFGEALQQILAKLDEIGLPVLIIHGNHEDERSLRKLCEKTRNIKFIHKTTVQTDGVAFMGYGGGGFSATDGDFETWSKAEMEKISEEKKVVLVTHAPPYGTKLDIILDQPAGNKSIRQFIKLYQPKLVICGHLHENAGMKDRLDKTVMINPGPWGAILEV